MTCILNFQAADGTGQPVGRPYVIGSRLIPAANFATSQSRALLYERLLAVVEASDLPVMGAVTPYSVGRLEDTSVTPAWYDSIWHVRIRYSCMLCHFTRQGVLLKVLELRRNTSWAPKHLPESYVSYPRTSRHNTELWRIPGTHSCP